MSSRIYKQAKKILKNKPSKNFERFLDNYFGHRMILFREEEDTEVWDFLSGKERLLAIDMILDNIDSEYLAYARAAGIVQDERALPKLRQLLKKGRSAYHKMTAAKIIYDWVGLDNYPNLAKKFFKDMGAYSKADVAYWIHGIPKEEAIMLAFELLSDEDSFVRWCAFSALHNFFNRQVNDEEKAYYIDDEVYADSITFNNRLHELKKIVTKW